MKELSIEEKAKAYDIALDKIKRLLGSGSNCSREELEHVFPELRESEGERIRKEIIAHIKWCEDSGYCAKEEMTRWITFLEKQGEQNTTKDYSTLEITDVVRQALQECESFSNIRADLYAARVGATVEYLIKKQGEQKSADKVEPKFKAGDWVVQGRNILKIRCVGDEYYCYETVGGYVDDMLVSEIDSLYHLWSIKDARDGDVLTCDNGRYIILFKEIKGNIVAYCSYNTHSKHFGFSSNYDTQFDCILKFTPATKEQRDALMGAVVGSGCAFGFEKKRNEKT